MIVYRDVVRATSTAECIAQVTRLARQGRATDFLVELGQFEQAVADSRHPRFDDWTPDDDAVRTLLLDAGAAFVNGHRGAGSDGFVAPQDQRSTAGILAAAERLVALMPSLPSRLRMTSAEGYAHYALDPGAYCASAISYARETGSRARDAIVIGIRSIGTSLSAIVAAAVGTPHSLTVRPRGESGARRVLASDRLNARVLHAVAKGADALVVDEGPGATGETFACVARWLRQIGVPAERLVLFPSQDGGMALAPQSRRDWFHSARRYPPPFHDERPRLIANRLGWTELENLSAGRWRDVVQGGRRMAARPHFERLKHRATDGDGVPVLLRYAGLGSWRDRTIERASALALAVERAGGAGVEPAGMAAGFGFISRPWLDGQPIARSSLRDPRFRRAVCEYVVARAALFPTGDTVDQERWADVLLENAGEAPGPRSVGLEPAVRRLRRLPARQAFIPDGRLQPHEWLANASGFVKVDATDHGDGFRLPGPADAAWDVAGVSVELRLTDAEVSLLSARCARAARQPSREMADAVAAHRPLYAATMFGDAALAAREVSDAADRALLEAEAARYARTLSIELRRAGAGAPVPRTWSIASKTSSLRVS